MRKPRGFTLIELLIALVLLALLGLMSWRALSASLDSRDHILSIEQRWQRLSRAINLIEANLLQIADRANPASDAQPDFQLIKYSTGEQQLVFLRMDATQGVRVAGFRQTGDALELLRWPSTHTGSDPVAEPLLDGVTAVRWAVRDNDTDWQDTWNKKTQPRGVRVQLDVSGIGTVEKLYAIH